MKITNRVRKAAQQSKIFRYKTYKKIGCVGYRKHVDRIVKFAMVFLLVVGAFLIIRPDSQNVPEDSLNCAPNCPVEPVVNPDAQEVVHSDLGDEPVIEDIDEDGASLIALEEAVRQNEAKLATYKIAKGETIAGLLTRAKIAKAQHKNIINTLETLVNVKTIKRGTIVLIFTGQKGEFLGLTLPFRDNEFVAVLKDEDGSLIPFSQEGCVENKNITIRGKIERTFSGSAQKYGAPKEIVNQIVNALNNEVNFRSGFKRGDAFEIIYSTQVTPTGLELDTGRQVLFVGLEMGNDKIYRYWYTDRSGTPAFYTPTGQREQRTLEKRPVKAVPRLSSPYGWRTHPILMYRVFHSGVDLACPRGTPIIAAGDGTITQLGRKGAYGKYIRIRHAGGYETAYGHMNGYKKGLKVGSRVKQGDVIGYVGATGRATGPHVHFEVWKNKKTTNPFNNNVISGKQLSGFELEQFQSFAESIHPDFSKHLFGKHPPVPARKPKTTKK